jgi:antirestriction protein ArdC
MSKVYDYVLEAIVARLNEGDIPWKQPWSKSPAINYTNRKEYRGINRLLLSGGEYLTYKQATALKGTVRKGAKGRIVVYYSPLEKEVDGKKEKMFVLRYYNVFHIDDIEGIESKLELKEHNIIEEAENVVRTYSDKPEIELKGERSFYNHKTDQIVVPQLNKFENPEFYYSNLFHELIHSTGHEDRLNRKTITECDESGGFKYSKENLIAEIGAAMLCGSVGIENITIENQAAYIQNWIQTLQSDKRLILHAAGAAQKAADYVLKVNNTIKEEEFEEVE